MARMTPSDWIASSLIMDTLVDAYHDIYKMVAGYEYVNIKTDDDARSEQMIEHMFIVPFPGMSDDLATLFRQLGVNITPKPKKMDDGVVRDGFMFVAMRPAINMFLMNMVTKAVKDRRAISAVLQRSEYIQSRH